MTVLGLSMLSMTAAAQTLELPVSVTDDTVIVKPGPDYEQTGLKRKILGAGWRELWITPVEAPVFDLSSYAGGVEIIQLGGGFQTITLHLLEKDGWREHRYRSVNKFPLRAMPEAIQGTLAGRILKDQVSTLFPAAPLLVSPLLQAIGALHVDAELYVMPDDPRLGEHRALFAGVLGTVELKPDNAPDAEPGFAGSPRVKGTNGFFDDLEESQEHRLDEAEFFAVRLIDFLVNDSDRTPNNFEWAAFPRDNGYHWRPVARDRDRAFMDARGWINQFLTRRFYPKLVAFAEEYPLEGLTYTTYQLDRRLLQRLNRADTERVALAVQGHITDDVIEQVIGRLPERWQAETSAADRLRTVLRARRNRLPDVARRFYEQLASDIDIRGTDENERVTVIRHDDGRVTVRITGLDDSEPKVAARPAVGKAPAPRLVGADVTPPAAFYERTFLPSETNEIRLYLRGGDDVAVVRGSSSAAIAVRIIGGGGDDVLIDSAGGANFFYDEAGENEFIMSADTRVSVTPWHAPREAGGFRLGTDWAPDWGGQKGWSLALGYKDQHGVLLGFGPNRRAYGFRRLPHHWTANAHLMVGTGSGKLGLGSSLDYRAENSALAYTMELRATQLESFRFYGFGNDTPDLGDAARVAENQIALQPALVWHIGWRAREGLVNPVRGHGIETSTLLPIVGTLQFGPVLYWSDPQVDADSPLRDGTIAGSRSFGRAGLRLGVQLESTDPLPVPTRGWTVQAEMIGFPPLWDAEQAFNTAHAVAAAYVPLPVGETSLALRAGGTIVTGAYPVQHAARVGGRTTLRGYAWQRFAGDQAAYASSELRVPVGTLNLLWRWQAGLFALADAGRVWFDGTSPGGWHTSYGGGAWLNALGIALSASYAHGEGDRVYLQTGLSF